MRRTAYHPLLSLGVVIAVILSGCLDGSHTTPALPTSEDVATANEATENGTMASGGSARSATGNSTRTNDTSSGGPDRKGNDPTSRRTMSSGTTPSAGAAFDPGWPPLDEAVIRPGVKLFDTLVDQLSLDDDPVHNGVYYQCSANFIFSSPDNRTLYIGTASHCVKEWSLGDTIPIAQGAVNATVAYCSWGTIAGTDACADYGTSGDVKEWNDFALLELPAEARDLVHPAVLHYGGPTGIAGEVVRGDIVLTYGNSDFRDLRSEDVPDPLDGRQGWVWNASAWLIQVEMNPTSVNGDSGSPVMTETGEALGVFRHWLYISCPGPRADVNGVTSLTAALKFMEAETGRTVELRTWPLLEEAQELSGRPDQPCDE